MGRAGEIAHSIVAVVIRRTGTHTHAQTSAIVGQQGWGAGLCAEASDVIGVPGGEALVEAAVGGSVHVEVG